MSLQPSVAAMRWGECARVSGSAEKNDPAGIDRRGRATIAHYDVERKPLFRLFVPAMLGLFGLAELSGSRLF
jgi:hypothetical protein